MKKSFGIPVLVAVAVAAAGAAVAGMRLLPQGGATPPAEHAATGDARAADAPRGFTSFRDDEVGFSISYPSSWERLEAADPSVRLVATPNRRDSLLVREIDLGFEVSAEQVPLMQQVTDPIVFDKAGRMLGGPDAVELGGLPGYLYVYEFADVEVQGTPKALGRAGIHAHYLLFRGDKILAIVLQAQPAERYEGLGAVFDAIASSFRADAQRPAASSRPAEEASATP